MKKFSIRFTVVSLFLLLATLIVLAMFYLQLASSKALAKKGANEHFALLSKDLNSDIAKTDALLDGYLELFESILEDSEQKNYKSLLKPFTIFLKTNKNQYSIHISNDKDLFFEIIKLDIDKKLLEQYGGKKGDKWLIVEIDEHSDKRKITLLDEALNPSLEKYEQTTYKPSQRPWFTKAKKHLRKTIKTEPYRFTNIDSRGITYAKTLKNGNVIATDILIANVDKMLEVKELAASTRSIILNRQLEAITNSTKKHNSTLIQKAQEELHQSKELPIHDMVKANGAEYIYYMDKLGDEFLFSYANLSDLTKPFRENVKTIVFAAIGVMVLFFPIIWYFASIIVKPIMGLAKENKKIEKLKFDKVKKIDSHISEIVYLSKSFVKMAKSIKHSQKILEKKVQERTRELEILSVTDKLTGLYNRIKIDEYIAKELARFNRYKKSFGIIFADIDHFKSVNDTYGHLVGDNVLKEFAALLKANSRKTDIVGRWGGEEFIILCIEIDEKSILNVAEKIRKIIQNHNFETIGKKTASFGVTMCKPNESLEQLVDRADKAMYIAKQNGRNRTEAIF